MKELSPLLYMSQNVLVRPVYMAEPVVETQPTMERIRVTVTVSATGLDPCVKVTLLCADG